MIQPIGERLKQARLAAGLSLRQLAELAGPLSATAISRYENGQDLPGSEVLLRLARALEVKVEYFFRPISVEIACPQFRKHSRLPAKVQTSLQHRIVDVLERYLAVEGAFGPKRFKPFEMPPAASLVVRDVGDAEAAAEQLRNDWGLGTDPINNLCGTLEDRGVKVLLVKPVEKFDGFACWANGQIPVVVAPDAPPRARQRLTLAHELGHLLLRLEGDVDEEKAAYRFAAAFLVPPSGGGDGARVPPGAVERAGATHPEEEVGAEHGGLDIPLARPGDPGRCGLSAGAGELPVQALALGGAGRRGRRGSPGAVPAYAAAGGAGRGRGPDLRGAGGGPAGAGPDRGPPAAGGWPGG